MNSEIDNEMINALKKESVDFFAMFPCEKVKRLYNLITDQFKHITLTREEEGVGICAGAHLAGARPAMLIQSSGIGNMVNALCSLTKVYHLPLVILVSWRGVYEEKIPAQIPMGEKLPKILQAIDVNYSIVQDKQEISLISEAAEEAYKNDSIHVVLLHPRTWRGQTTGADIETQRRKEKTRSSGKARRSHRSVESFMTRLEIIRTVAPYLKGRIVVCNLGIPSKELYSVMHQKTNFYMLGSLGLASSIGLGISLFTAKEVLVIDGDGSLLTNLGALSTIAAAKPRYLTILAIDNGVHGSTGNQITATNICADLEYTARGLGIEKTYKVAAREEILSTLQNLRDGPNFVHILAKPGNADVPDIPLSPLEIKINVMKNIREGAISYQNTGTK